MDTSDLSGATAEQQIIAELYGWIIDELDSSPEPIASYLSEPHLAPIAQAALRAAGVTEAPAEEEDEGGDQ